MVKWLYGYIVILLLVTTVSKTPDVTTHKAPYPTWYRGSGSSGISKVYAQEESTDSADIDEKINLIKEKVASKVAELSEEISTGLTGAVSETKEGLFTIQTNGAEKTVQAKDAKVLIRNNKLKTSKGNISQLKEGDLATVVGKEQFGTDIIKADLIVSTPEIVFFAGKVTKIDKTKFRLSLEEGKEEYIFDYETYTQASKFENGKFSKIGFSDIEKEAFVQILATPQESSQNQFTAQRLISIQI